MKMAWIIATAALVLAGCCSSHSEISRWNTSVTLNDGEVPIGSFLTQNLSYQLFGVIPISTGVPWTSGDGDSMTDFKCRLFAEEATLDNNLRTLQHALDNVGSHRITELNTIETNDWTWSLFLIRRHMVLTKCIILKDDGQAAAPAK